MQATQEPRAKRRTPRERAAWLAQHLPGVSSIPRAFVFLAVAEELLEAEGWLPGQHPKGVLRLLEPGPLIGYAEDLYRGHCRELISRVWNGLDCRPGTDAECCVAFCEASLRAPLNASCTHAYEECFARVFGYLPQKVEPIGRYSWPGEGAEIIGQLRKRLARADRVLIATPTTEGTEP